ncbi:MAG TPA: response regulator transcription factor [Noviherbaspirillum sp.]|nr:response regulator transcription factor [Noviherbaspirillum sp.]
MEKRKITVACVISDDTAYAKVCESLQHSGFALERLHSDTELLRIVRRRTFDLIILDIGTAPLSGTSILSWLSCHAGNATPFILLSAAASSEQVAAGLNAGADDYIFKPLSEMEFAARVKAVLRRCSHHHTPKIINVKGFTLDQDARLLLDNGVPVDLTPREFTMAWLLFSSLGFYLTREAITTAIWGIDVDIASRTIEQHIYKLRKKLKLSEARGVVIRAAYTCGYRLELSDSTLSMTMTSHSPPAAKGKVRPLALA